MNDAGAPAGQAGLVARHDAGTYVLPFGEITLDDVPLTGGKNASLGEMIRALAPRGVAVPDGFALTADAFRWTIERAGLTDRIYPVLDHLDVGDVGQLAAVAGRIREQIRAAPLPAPVTAQVRAAYLALSRQYGEESTDVAVRSSGTAEDLPRASFAGQHESFLNVRGPAALDQAIRSCFASLFTDRAIVYRAEHGFAHRDVALSVGVQKMVRSDLASGGVIFTLDTETGFRDIVLVTGAWGIAETVVQGRVRPDEFWVHKPTLRAGFRPVFRREVADKARKLIYADGGAGRLEEVTVPDADRRRVILTDDEVLQLARWALMIEDHYSGRAGRPMPMDIEWAKDGRLDRLFIVQARPETAHSRAAPPAITLYRLTERGTLLVTGKSVGSTIASGQARVMRSPGELGSFRAGEVLVAPMTDPAWEPVLRRATAVVTDEGGRTCHAAIVSREIGIPCVVGAGSATRLLDGRVVTVSCAEGDDGKVYEGRLAFEREDIDPARLPAPPVPLMLNLGNPENAFQLGQLPSAGVGLARTEFIVSGWIGVHPMALAHPDRVADASTREAIEQRIRGWASPAEFFIERLAAGVGQIAAAFYPRPVIVRFSDFKTNEYAALLGGAGFEPVESNPMLGFRGASRYYDERYRDGFALECAAIRRVRERFGLRNVKVMIPFCRTLDEARRVLAALDRNGLARGRDGLEVYVMCEIPNNVVLAAEFAELFDGFSIGSNDLTQLALGVDRDSELLAHLFDERDPGVKRLIEQVVVAARRKGRPVGICGQAPSDYPDFADFLVSIGIDSISLNADSLARVVRHLAARRAGAGAQDPG
jgi:pyruvate,water dikinase